MLSGSYVLPAATSRRDARIRLIHRFQALLNAVRGLPQPVSMPPEPAARYAHYIRLLGGKTPEEELAAALRAREWLEQIAD